MKDIETAPKVSGEIWFRTDPSSSEVWGSLSRGPVNESLPRSMAFYFYSHLFAMPSFYLAKPEEHGSEIWTVIFQPSHVWFPSQSPSATPQQRQCQPHSAGLLQLRLWLCQVLHAAELSIPPITIGHYSGFCCSVRFGECVSISAPCWTQLWPQHCQVFITVLWLRYGSIPAANASLGETSFHYKYHFSLLLASLWHILQQYVTAQQVKTSLKIHLKT